MKTCHKTPYQTRYEAVRTACNMTRRTKPMRVVFCEQCDAFHVVKA